MLGLIAKPHTIVGYDVAQSSVAHAQFPHMNLANNDYGRVAQFTSEAVSTYGWVYDLGANPPATDVVAVLWHNLRSTDAIHIQAGNTPADAVAGTLYFAGSLPPITGTSKRDTNVGAPCKFLLTLSNPITARYWRLAWSQNTLMTTPFRASRFFIGKKQLFQIGPQKAENGAVDLNMKFQVENGEERSSEDPLLIRPTCQLDFTYAKETEMADLLGQYTLGLGVSRPMLCVSDIVAASGLQDRIVFGRPENIISLQSEIYDAWRFQARVRSIGP